MFHCVCETSSISQMYGVYIHIKEKNKKMCELYAFPLCPLSGRNKTEHRKKHICSFISIGYVSFMDETEEK